MSEVLELLLLDAAWRWPEQRAALAEHVSPEHFADWRRREAFLAGVAMPAEAHPYDVAAAMAEAGHVGVVDIISLRHPATGEILDARHGLAAADQLAQEHRRRRCRLAIEEAGRRLDLGADLDAVLAHLEQEWQPA